MIIQEQYPRCLNKTRPHHHNIFPIKR